MAMRASPARCCGSPCTAAAACRGRSRSGSASTGEWWARPCASARWSMRPCRKRSSPARSCRFTKPAKARRRTRCCSTAHRAQRHGRPVAAIMLDIDHFKRFNDSFGHEAGDLVLRELAGALGRSTRGSDVASRYGGEEFLVLLPECPFDAALRRAERMREDVAKLELRYDDRPLGPVTVSLGVAVFPDHTKESEELLRFADEALYAPKQAGRNRVVAYSADPQKAGARAGV